MRTKTILRTLIPLTLALMLSVCGAAAREPIELSTMGSFAFGGTVDIKDDGTTFHGDHGYAQYYIPYKSRHYPIVLWHGVGQSGRCFETTPDGREGFSALLPRDDYPVYIVDQPRRGRAGYTNAPKIPSDVPTVNSEAQLWEAFRIGPWNAGSEAQVFEESAFPLDPTAVDQFFREQTPSTAEEPRTAEFNEFMAKTGAALFDIIGDGILLTHSRAGYYGWEIAIASDKVKAVIAIEPGACAFPDSAPAGDFEILNDMVRRNATPPAVPDEKWERLLEIPILIVYGDNIAKEPTAKSFNGELWRVSQKRAQQFADLINARGGDATLISLPELGFKGNTHAPFADLNNVEFLKVLENFLSYKGLDSYEDPHEGPVLPRLDSYTLPLSEERAAGWE